MNSSDLLYDGKRRSLCTVPEQLALSNNLRSMVLCNTAPGSPSTNIAPHRGFNAKAREVLIGNDDMHLNGMPHKSCSDFDLRKKLVNTAAMKRQDSTATNNSNSPKSQSSTQSVADQKVFDSIGDETSIKKHKKLAQIGKTRSCVEIKTDKTVDKRIIKTFQEENILKMPSIDSDIGSCPIPCSELEDLTLGLDTLGKAHLYSVTNDDKKKSVKKWLDKQ